MGLATLIFALTASAQTPDLVRYIMLQTIEARANPDASGQFSLNVSVRGHAALTSVTMTAPGMAPIPLAYDPDDGDFALLDGPLEGPNPSPAPKGDYLFDFNWGEDSVIVNYSRIQPPGFVNIVCPVEGAATSTTPTFQWELCSGCESADSLWIEGDADDVDEGFEDERFPPDDELFTPPTPLFVDEEYDIEIGISNASKSVAHTVNGDPFDFKSEFRNDTRLVFTTSSELDRVCGIQYASLGDSFSSGEGARPYDPATDISENRCHRSEVAYSTMVRAPGHPLQIMEEELLGVANTDWKFVACSGARAVNVVGPIGQHNELPQLDQGVVSTDTDLITITIGGNDLGFGTILELCRLWGDCPDRPIFGSMSTLTTREYVTGLLPRVKALNGVVYDAIKGKAPTAAVVVLGYPNPLPISDLCGLGGVTNFSDIDLQFLHLTAIRLNLALKEVAAAKGVHFIDNVLSHFYGHDACAGGNSWMNAARLWNVEESYHPNPLGQEEYARLVNDYLGELTPATWPQGFFPSGLPENPPLPMVAAPAVQAAAVPSIGPLDVMPEVPQPCEANGAYTLGEVIRLQGDSFEPLTTVSLSLESLDGTFTTSLGNAVADATGGLDATITVPPAAPAPGVSLVQALATGSNGEPRLLAATIKIGTSFADDGDGDGVPDICDSCPALSHPNQDDSDGDGIGDECDPCPLDFYDDLDGDSLCGGTDICPLDPENDVDGDGVCANADNCPIDYNPDQTDSDADDRGDVCAGISCHSVDVFAHQPIDGRLTVTNSNCELDKFQTGSPVQIEATPDVGMFFTGWTGSLLSQTNPLSLIVTGDLNLVANFCADSVDGDGDLVADDCDNCPLDVNSDQLDADGDGEGDACDNCPETPNGPDGGTCTEGDSNLIGGLCESDGDCGSGGFCSLEQEDYNTDGLGDACDPYIVPEPSQWMMLTAGLAIVSLLYRRRAH